MTAEDIYEARDAGEPVMWSERQVEAIIASHDVYVGDDLHCLELVCLLAAVSVTGRIDAAEVLDFLGY